MLMKRGLVLLLVFLLSFGILFAQGDGENGAEAGSGAIVGMATDTGGLGDKSFNDGVYEGLKKAESELGVEVRLVESKQQTDYVPNLSGFAEDGASLVFATGFLMAEAVVEVANQYPDVSFAGVDIFAGDNAPSNFQGILFKEEQAGYLAGVVAGYMTKEYASATDKLNDDNVLGIVLGMFIPPVERFEVGFSAGAKAVNPDVEIISVTVGSFTDQAKGKEAAIAMIEQGADIIFHAAGLTGLGAINAAQESGILAIGVDVDQNAAAPDTVLTSAEKRLVQAAFLSTKATVEGNFVGGNMVYGIKEDAVGISPFHSFDKIVPDEVKAAVDSATEDMKAGKIVVPTTRAELN